MPQVWFESMNNVFHKMHVSDAPPSFILHEFTGPDDGDPHDHPFDIEVTILRGGYEERRYDPKTGTPKVLYRKPGDTFIILATAIHRISQLLDGPCLTMATYGPWVQEPGFWRFDHSGAMRRQHNLQEWVRK